MVRNGVKMNQDGERLEQKWTTQRCNIGPGGEGEMTMTMVMMTIESVIQTTGGKLAGFKIMCFLSFLLTVRS